MKFSAKTFSFSFFYLLYAFLESTCDDNVVTNDSEKAEAIFRNLYKAERAEQLAAVKSLLKLGKEDKQKQMVQTIAQKVFEVIKKSKKTLENARYIPGESNFPWDENVRDALSNVLENTAFFGDIILRLPDISHEVLKDNLEWNYLLKWGLFFTKQTALVDQKTHIMLTLVNQEMNYTERHVNFTNPFRKKSIALAKEEILLTMKPKPKKRKTIPKGPRLSRRTDDL
ncbi:coiled-coil domain-containing protein 134-like [Cimex lectularius]|uniref:Coiled-coil domain-containing protein 134 n=1 Tax=Cimex lectularius TaxID=79782 RepID=A0A8I6RRH8_CIMLE|nr:coiled-coil domain-containing protein 134-like [Cimex lectularius]